MLRSVPCLVLALALSACASASHRHVAGDPVYCPHRAHRNVVPVATETVVVTPRVRYAEGQSRFADRREGAALYEGDIGFSLQQSDPSPRDPDALAVETIALPDE